MSPSSRQFSVTQCATCGNEIEPRRSTRTYCPDAYRQKACRQRAASERRTAKRRNAADLRFPVEAVADLLREALESSGETIEGLARRSGLQPRQLRRILNHEHRSVTLWVLDDLLTYGLDAPHSLWTDPRLAAIYGVAA